MPTPQRQSQRPKAHSDRVLQTQRRDGLHRLLPRAVAPDRNHLLAIHHPKHLARVAIIPRPPKDRLVRVGARARAVVRVERRDEADEVVRERLVYGEGNYVVPVRLVPSSAYASVLVGGAEPEG